MPSTIAPRNTEPSAMPILNAAIFNPNATSTAFGVYRLANFTTYTCKPGTLPKANAPHTNTVNTASTRMFIVNVRVNSMSARAVKIMAIALATLSLLTKPVAMVEPIKKQTPWAFSSSKSKFQCVHCADCFCCK